jgi:methionine-rich copper-binding protein CopC
VFSIRAVLLAILALGLGAVSALGGEIAVENPDGVPFEDRLVMSRVVNSPALPTHVVATSRIRNEDGSGPLEITGLSVTGSFQLESPPALPASIPAGGTLDVDVRFTGSTAPPVVHEGTLEIVSDDADEPTTVVELAGLHQQANGGPNERDLVEIVEDLYGYGTDIVGPGQDLSNGGVVEAVGDEVLSPYWVRADPSQPVVARQLAAFHGAGTATLSRYAKGTTSTTGTLTHDGDWYQTVLPLRSGSSELATATFTPPPTFGFRVSTDAWSDPTLNAQGSCTDGCGHFVRFWPVKDRDGQVVPNQYLMGMDYPLGNYDYQDNIYLVENIAPDPAADTTAPQVTDRTPAPDATGVAVGADVTVDFSEALDPGTVDAASVQIAPQGGSALAATRTLSGADTTLTIDPDADLAPDTTYDVTLTGAITDVAGNPLDSAPVTWSFTTAPDAGGTGAYQFDGDTVTVEAENADAVIDRSGTGWQPTSSPVGAVGQAMVIPEAGSGWGDISEVPTQAPELSFQIEFPAAGTYDIYVRANPPDQGSNSVHVGLNGTLTTSSDGITHNGFNAWQWMKYSAAGPNPATISVPSAGVHTVNLWGREDGTPVDRIVITQGAAPTGEGPPESARGGDPPPPPPDGAYQFDGDTVTVEAENADEVIDRSATGWQATSSPAGAVGQAMVIPEAGTGWGDIGSAPTTAPELSFQIEFPAAGAYDVYVRANPPDQGSNSVHAGINGTITTTSDQITHSGFNAWQWMKYSGGGPNPATVSVPSAGVHTFSVYGREDGTPVDRIVITQGAAPTGEGPPESARGGV